MKIKSLLFAALVAGMSFAANAETQYDSNDKVTFSCDEDLKAGESTVLTFYLEHESNVPDFTNLQFDIIFPEGIRPLYDEDMEMYGWAGPGASNKAGVPYISYSDNMKDATKYPHHTVVGANMTKKAIEKNPCDFYCLNIVADADCPTGDYEFKVSNLKLTCFNNDSYKTAAEQVAGTIHVTNPTTGINDLQVNNAKTYKTIENGQVIIVKGDVRYNTMGQIVK